MKTIDVLLEESQLTLDEIAERAALPLERMEAIVVGRWTPSPEDRRRVAEAFGVPAEEIVWGHQMDPRNIRYRRFGLREGF